MLKYTFLVLISLMSLNEQVCPGKSWPGHQFCTTSFTISCLSSFHLTVSILLHVFCPLILSQEARCLCRDASTRHDAAATTRLHQKWGFFQGIYAVMTAKKQLHFDYFLLTGDKNLIASTVAQYCKKVKHEKIPGIFFSKHCKRHRNLYPRYGPYQGEKGCISTGWSSSVSLSSVSECFSLFLLCVRRRY